VYSSSPGREGEREGGRERERELPSEERTVTGYSAAKQKNN